MSRKIFVVGTGTDIGKTYVTGLLLKTLLQGGYSAAYYKAAMSGNSRRADGSLIPGDALQVQTMSGSQQPLASMCPYIYETAVSPHLAARLEGGPVDMAVVRQGLADLAAQYDYLTMEGSGGILCPIRWDGQQLWLEDIIRELGFSCLLVADAGLGTINAVGLTAAYMRAKKLPLLGVIYNNFTAGDVMQEDNRQMCEKLTGLPTLACVPTGAQDFPLPARQLAALYQ